MAAWSSAATEAPRYRAGGDDADAAADRRAPARTSATEPRPGAAGRGRARRRAGHRRRQHAPAGPGAGRRPDVALQARRQQGRPPRRHDRPDRRGDRAGGERRRRDAAGRPRCGPGHGGPSHDAAARLGVQVLEGRAGRLARGDAALRGRGRDPPGGGFSIDLRPPRPPRTGQPDARASARSCSTTAPRWPRDPRSWRSTARRMAGAVPDARGDDADISHDEATIVGSGMRRPVRVRLRPRPRPRRPGTPPRTARLR